MKSVVTRHSGLQPYNKPGPGICYLHNNKRCISSHSEPMKHPQGPVLKIKQGFTADTSRTPHLPQSKHIIRFPHSLRNTPAYSVPRICVKMDSAMCKEVAICGVYHLKKETNTKERVKQTPGSAYKGAPQWGTWRTWNGVGWLYNRLPAFMRPEEW